MIHSEKRTDLSVSFLLQPLLSDLLHLQVTRAEPSPCQDTAMSATLILTVSDSSGPDPSLVREAPH